MKRAVIGIAAMIIILSLSSCRYIKAEQKKDIYTQIELTTEIETSENKATEKYINNDDITVNSETTTNNILNYIIEETNTVENRYGTLYYNDEEAIYISPEEYYTICGIVMNETGYGSYEGCVAVAQAIRNQIIREKRLGHDYDIASVRSTYGLHYTKKPNDLVRRAVTDVFYNHIVVTEEPIIAWCAGYSSWHSSQIEVCSYDGNTFYKLRGE